ncbi:MAG: hypothetical protein R2799_11300, partial [Crocinitomicaceae bacterium]
MIKKIFISSIDRGKSIPSENKGFVEDLKYSINLKFPKGQVVISDSELDVDTHIFLIPKGKKSAAIHPNSKNFYINFDPDQPLLRNRYFYDLSIKNKNTEQEQIEKSWWNTITDVLFQLDENHAQNNGKIVFVAETSLDQIENRR